VFIYVIIFLYFVERRRRMEKNIKERVSQIVNDKNVKEKLTQFFQEKIINRILQKYHLHIE
jgi:hypothetical protein